MKDGETIAVEQVQHKEQSMSTEQTVEAKVAAEGQPPVEAAPVEAEVATETETTVTLSEQTDKAVDRVAELTAERDALAVERDGLKKWGDLVVADCAALRTERDELAGKLTKAEADLTALKAERDEACAKLAAIVAGQPPVSANPAPKDKELTPWQKAQAAARGKR